MPFLTGRKTILRPIGSGDVGAGFSTGNQPGQGGSPPAHWDCVNDIVTQPTAPPNNEYEIYGNGVVGRLHFDFTFALPDGEKIGTIQAWAYGLTHGNSIQVAISNASRSLPTGMPAARTFLGGPAWLSSGLFVFDNQLDSAAKLATMSAYIISPGASGSPWFSAFYLEVETAYENAMRGGS